MNRITNRLALALGVAIVVITAAVLISSGAGASQSTQLQTARDQLANCQLLAANSSGNQHTRAQQCAADQQRIITLLTQGSPSPTPTSTTPSPSPTPTVSPTPTPTSTGGAWPDGTNTGVPAGTALTAYAGPCTITTASTVIDAKVITCAQLVIKANGVRVTRSSIAGSADPAVAVSGGDLTISDSTIVAAVNTTGLGDNNWTGIRLNVSGGNRGANCDNRCTLQDSWLHGQRVSGTTHASGLRAGQFTTAVHNTLNCEAPADNCSADLTGYPDFAPTHDWTITGNLFIAQHLGGGYFCSYGGATKGKPYSTDPANAVNIQFRNNTYQHGPGGWCGGYPDGAPISDYDTSRPGWVWSGNVWDSGEPVTV